MPQLPLPDVLDELRARLTDPDALVRAVAAGKRRSETPRWSRVELRPVTIKGNRLLQVVATSDRPHTSNVDFGDPLVAELLAEPFGNWHVETTTETIQLRVTKKGEAQVSRQAASRDAADTAHDRKKAYLLPPDDPIYDVIGGNAAKRRQVDAFLRALDATLGDARPKRIVDLGCGNAYLTFAAYRYLTLKGLDTEVVGVDIREDQRKRNTELAERLGWAGKVTFVAGTILDAPVDSADVVLALHACDTATDEALARAVEWGAEYILAAPCCHHDLASQLKKHSSPIVGQPILRERFADVLTDTLRALILRQLGYKVEVAEFVDSAHTPRNLLIRARRGAAPAGADEYRALLGEWQVSPWLARALPAS
ncbi:class I SAM-dependent methyltransferase [Longispora albida]|uniref:class I SAM-dependent methyltransferase n=1 Tax=Longispora albida TaxID=203523 RepID=UPI0003829DF0|nr:SAM-dependent methyltransferase [Longispora albida]